MKRKLFLAVILLPCLACTNPDTRVESNVEVPVEVEEITLKPIEEFVVSTGTVKATMDALMKSESEGYYRLGNNPRTSRPFALGNAVRKGEVIIYIDNPEQENTIKIESHKLNMENTQREYEKQKSLYDKGGVTLRELKNAEVSFVDAKYSYENALIQLSKLKITAPFNGIIVDLPYYTKGVKIPVNSDMAHIMDYSVLNMEVNLPGKLLGVVQVRQPVRISNYSIPDKKLSGIITQVSPALDTDTRTFKAEIDINNPEKLLRPGMFVKAEIVTASKDSAIVIPKDIVITRRNRKTVFVVSRSFAEERRISTGLENPDIIEVINGLNVNERLVIGGFETLRNGSRVRISR